MKTRSAKTRPVYALMLLATALCLRTAGAAPTKAAAPAPPPVVVTLAVEKQIAPTDRNVPPTWRALGPSDTTVLPGDILRYTVTGSSRLARPIKGFVLTQPIPRGTEYLPQSASPVAGDARMAASLDGGKTYAERPTVKVTHPDGTTTDEPAPASLYTDLRWTFGADLPALGSVAARCEVRVR